MQFPWFYLVWTLSFKIYIFYFTIIKGKENKADMLTLTPRIKNILA